MFMPMQGGGMPMMGSMGGLPFCMMSPNGQLISPGGGQFGMPQMMGMQGGQGVQGGIGGMAAVQGPNGQIIMVPLMGGQNFQQGQQSGQQQSQNNSSSTNNATSGHQGGMPGMQSMQGMPMGLMMGGQGGMQGMMLPQHMMGMMNPQMAMMGLGGQQQSGSNGSSQLPGLNFGQFSGGMGFMMPGQSGQKNDKQSNGDAAKAADSARRSDNHNSNRKDDSGPSYLDQNQNSNGPKHQNMGGLPPFLAPSSGGQFSGFPGSQQKQGEKQNSQKNPMGPGQGGFPGNIAMMNGGMLTP